MMSQFLLLVTIRQVISAYTPPHEYPIQEFDIALLPSSFYSYYVWFLPAQFASNLLSGVRRQFDPKDSYLINIDYNSDQQPVLFHYVQLSTDLTQVIHKMVIIKENSIYEYQAQFKNKEYEWRWILFILTVDPINLKSQMLIQGQSECILIQLDFDIYGKIGGLHQQFGGAAEVKFKLNNVNHEYMLHQFRGGMESDYIQGRSYLSSTPLVDFYAKNDANSYTDDVRLVQKLENYQQGNQIVDYLTTGFFNSPIYLVGWLKLNNYQQGQQKMTAIDIQGDNPYEPETKLPYIKIEYFTTQVNQNTLFISFTEFDIPFKSYGIVQTKEFGVNENVYQWHFINLYIHSDKIMLQIKFINAEINEEYQWRSYFINHASIMLGGDLGYWYNGMISNLYFGKCTQCEMSTYYCHTSCATCNGPFYYSCTSCKDNSFRQYNSVTHTCKCAIGSVDYEGEYCVQYFNLVNERMITTKFNQEWFEDSYLSCELGYFQVDNQCYPCPSVIRPDYISCAECLRNPKTWIINPQCSTDLFRTPEADYFTEVQRRIQLATGFFLGAFTVYDTQDPNSYYWMNNVLNSIQNIQYICPQDPITTKYSAQCDQVQGQTHLGQPLYVYCQTYAYFNDEICEFDNNYTQVPPSDCSFKCDRCSGGDCDRCSDNIKYFISITGDVCLECTILNCKYCFHYKTTNHKISSLEYMFQKQNMDETIATGCAKCYDGFSFNFQTELCEQETNFLPNCIQQYRDSEPKCLLTNTDNFIYGASSNKCQTYLLNCLICIKRQNRVICIKCNLGYYIDTETGFCTTKSSNTVGLSEINKQDKFQKNAWMWELQAFYYVFIPGNNLYIGSNYQFFQELVVICLRNYYPKGASCIKCPDECTKCDIRGCIECQQDQYQKYSLIGNKCIKCQTYCDACLPRSEAQIKAYNPLFSDLQSQITSCVVPQKQTQDINFYLDNMIGVVRVCQKYQKCSIELNGRATFNFRSKLYAFMNIMGVDSIITDDTIDYARFSVFSVRNSITLIETQSSFKKFPLESKDFIQLTLLNFRYILEKSSVHHILSQYQQYKLTFDHFEFRSNLDITTNFNISQCNYLKINSLTIDSLNSKEFFILYNKQMSFEIDTLIIRNSVFNNMIFIDFFQSGQNFTIKNINIINCIFINTIIFKQQYLFMFQQISFEFISITNCTFENSSLLYSDALLTILNQLEFKDLRLNNSILIRVQQFTIQGLSLQNLSLQSSQILQSEQQFEVKRNIQLQIRQLYMINCQILNFSSDLTSVFNIKWLNNNILLNDIILHNNYCVNCNKQEENDVQNFEYLILLQVNIVQVQNMAIDKIFGLTEIFIKSTQNVTLFNLTIYSQFVQGILPQTIECLPSQQGKIASSVVRLHNIKFIQIQSCLIKNCVLINSPIIYISLDTSVLSGQILDIFDTIIKDNIIFKSSVLAYMAIIYIQSDAIQIITFNNVEFDTNWFNVYYESNKQDQSATVIRIVSPLSSVSLQNSQMKNIMITNSTQTNIYISASDIQITNCIFKQINIFEWKVYSKFVSWGFKNDQQVYHEQITDIYSINSIGGIAFLEFNNLVVQNSNIENTLAAQAGCFYLLTRQASKIYFLNNIISNTSVTNIGLNSFAGALVIESNQQELVVQFTSNKIYSSSSYIEAGFMKIYPALIKNQMIFSDSSFYDSYSLSNLIACAFQINSYYNIIKLVNITIINSKIGFQHYLSKIPTLSSFQIDISDESRTIISVIGGILILDNCIFSDIEIWGLLKIQNGLNVVVQDTKVQNCKFWNTPLFSIQLANKIGQITILRVQLINIVTMTIDQNQKCNELKTTTQPLLLCKINLSITPSQILSFFDEKHYQDQMMCNLIEIIGTGSKIDSLLQIKGQQNFHQFQLLNSLLYNIHCQDCNMGLVKITGNSTLQVVVTDTAIQHNECGNIGCISIIGQNGANDSTLLTNITQDVFEQSQYRKLQAINQPRVTVSNLLMNNNKAKYGACLMMFGIFAEIDGLTCINSIASISSAFHFISRQSSLAINNSSFSNNIGLSDVFLKNLQINMNQLKLSYKIVEPPSKVTISLDSHTSLLNQTSLQGQVSTHWIQRNITQLNNGSFSNLNIIMIPSGQSILNYKIFDKQLNTQLPYNQTFRIVALNQQMEIQNNLAGSNCQLNTSILDTRTNSVYEITQGQIAFNETTQDYNLDNMKIIFDPMNPKELVVELRIACQSVITPEQQNYILVAHLQTYMCQLGEMYFNGQCLPCDSNLNQYSVNPNKNLCEIKNSITTSEITAATINLKQGYWRYTYTSDEILQCVNNQDNCKGGWISGEQSCEVGHLGCLCESCDLYDVRGSGSYYSSDSFSCQNCTNQNSSSVIITLITTLIVLGTTLITVNSQFTINTQIQELKQKTTQYRLVHRLTQDQSGALTKLMMNFFLVIGSILTKVREIPQSTILVFQVVSSSPEIIAYSYDCAFNEVSIDILYMRLIWQIILPFLYFGVILILYIMILRYKFAEAKFIVITTTLIYLFILSQPNIIKEAVSLLSYRNISNEKWILRNVAYVYGTRTHIIFIVFMILPILGIFGILWPGTLFYILLKNRKTQYETKTRYLIGYLYNEYNPHSYYWEIVRIIYKALILTVVAFFQDYSTLRYCFTSIIILIYLILLKQQQPYNQKKLNQLESRILMASMSIILIAQAILSIDINDFSALATILFLILMVIVGFVLYIILKEFTTIILKKFQAQIDQLKYLILQWFPQAGQYQCLSKLLKPQQKQKQIIINRFQRIRKYLILQVRNFAAYQNKENEKLEKKQNLMIQK